MAADAGRVRVEEHLLIKIGEAKNLPPRSHGTGIRDTYCCISLDQEEIYRTSTVERTLNPFFGDHFQFDVPRGFRYLSIYVFDRDRSNKQDKVLGKVAIHREELKKYGTDHWFALQPVDADSEVQGKAHIEIVYEGAFPKITSISTEDELPSGSPRPSNNSYTEDVQMIGGVEDRKHTKTKKDNLKFHSYSSMSSKKILPLVYDTPMSLGRSESLRTGQTTLGHQSMHHTYGPSTKFAKLPFADDVQFRKHRDYIEHSPSLGSELSTTLGSAESNFSYKEIVSKCPSQSDLRNKLSVKVLECSELTVKNGQCDPYAEVTVLYKNGKKVSKRTKAKKKTMNPKFDECFVFDLTLESNSNKERESSSNNTYTVWPAAGWDDTICGICVSLWHDTFFLGEVRLPLQTLQHRAVLNTSAWYLLGSRQGFSHQNSGSGNELNRGSTPSGTQYSNITPTSLGSLRLNLHHTLDRVLPSQAYDGLRSLLLQQPQFQPITSSAVFILGKIVNVKDLAQPLVRLLTYDDLLIPTVKALADAELSTLTDVTTIFRGNTIVSKMMDETMKLVGLTYLKSTLKPTLDLIFSEKKSCEIDPTKVKDLSTVESNLANLIEYVEKMFNAITESFVNCPGIMCRLFDVLRQCANQKFPRDDGVRFSVVSSFIFLRFFAPAILGPRLFSIKSEQVDAQTNRTLTLISKTITTLGNLVSSRSSQQVCKEEYMGALYKHVCTEKHVKAIKRFLEIISSSRETQNSNTQNTPVLLKEGVMIKRTQRPKRFMRNNMKKRHFRLTSCELSYSKSKGKRLLCSIPLADIVAADIVTEVNNLKMNNMFQIVYRDRTLYVQAINCVERKEWLDLLGKLCEGHSSQPQKYHRATYTHGQWSCCKLSNEDAIGCATAASRSCAAVIPLKLDPTRDLQRIHCLLYEHISYIEKLLQGNPNTPVCIEDTASLRTLRELSKVTYSLEDKHRTCQRHLERATKYGSKQAPIGDDNYLHLASGNGDSSMRPVIKHSQSTIESEFLVYNNSPQMHNSMKSRAISPKSLPRFVKSSTKPVQFSMPINDRTDNLMLSLKSQKNTSFSDDDLSNTDYLNNSLYIASSTESDKISGTNSEEMMIPERNKNNDSSSGYLRMLGVKNNSDFNDSNIQHILKKNSNVLPDKIINISTSEYVPVTPNTPERDVTSIKLNKISLPPKGDIYQNNKLTIEEMANSPQYYCPEYELMADFTSPSKNAVVDKDIDLSPDAPPAIPPRNHHITSPSYTKYKKPSSFPKEYKSLEQYQLKAAKSPDGRKSPKIENDVPIVVADRLCCDNDNFNNTQESADSSILNPPISQEPRSQIANNSCELLPLSKTCELNIDSKISNFVVVEAINERAVLSDNFQHRHSDTVRELNSGLVSSKDWENVSTLSGKESSESVDESMFARNAQRKSAKSKFAKADGSADSASKSSQTPIPNFATAFLKRKTKVNT
ncbi:ras GTPase activating protein 1 [Arctopsyche grandis]|uniref:ras GTPase activating protein 1 n=1 Tax=Arctopsyche grandis TaxID=121162 RepID=UPI00406D902E